jgi:hypothetical protein
MEPRRVSATPLAFKTVVDLGSGGVASLRPRLISGNPPGSAATRAPSRSHAPAAPAGSRLLPRHSVSVGRGRPGSLRSSAVGAWARGSTRAASFVLFVFLCGDSSAGMFWPRVANADHGADPARTSHQRKGLFETLALGPSCNPVEVCTAAAGRAPKCRTRTASSGAAALDRLGRVESGWGSGARS